MATALPCPISDHAGRPNCVTHLLRELGVSFDKQKNWLRGDAMRSRTIALAAVASTSLLISTMAHAITARDVPGGTRQHCYGRVVLISSKWNPALPVIHIGPNAGCTFALGGAIIGGTAVIGDRVLATCPIGDVCDFTAIVTDDYEGVLVGKVRRVQ